MYNKKKCNDCLILLSSSGEQIRAPLNKKSKTKYYHNVKNIFSFIFSMLFMIYIIKIYCIEVISSELNEKENRVDSITNLTEITGSGDEIKIEFIECGNSNSRENLSDACLEEAKINRSYEKVENENIDDKSENDSSNSHMIEIDCNKVNEIEKFKTHDHLKTDSSEDTGMNLLDDNKEDIIMEEVKTVLDEVYDSKTLESSDKDIKECNNDCVCECNLENSNSEEIPVKCESVEDCVNHSEKMEEEENISTDKSGGARKKDLNLLQTEDAGEENDNLACLSENRNKGSENRLENETIDTTKELSCENNSYINGKNSLIIDDSLTVEIDLNDEEPLLNGINTSPNNDRSRIEQKDASMPLNKIKLGQKVVHIVGVCQKKLFDYFNPKTDASEKLKRNVKTNIDKEKPKAVLFLQCIQGVDSDSDE